MSRVMLPRRKLHARERKALEHFAGGPAEAPSGVGPVTIFNLVQKRLLQRTERLEDFGPQLYDLTDKGRAQLLAIQNSN